MANRKVLINYHTSGSSAPTPADVFHGELVVAHETGKETIFTKNNANEMIPFISCAQTIEIINSKIQASDTDVMVKAGEQHLEVSAGTGDEANKFTLNTKDVQSEEEFKAYSAATKIRIDDVYSAETALTAVVSALTDIVITGITGDTIITATLDQQNTGSNVYTLTHKTGEETDGFKKLSTDAYGHVTASTDVLTSDIEALGFKTSADTLSDLEQLSASVVANETHISELSAGTQHDIEALSGDVIEYVKVVSGGIETVINELSAGTIMVSGYAHNKIVEAYDSATTYAGDAIEAAIEALGSVSASTGKYFTAIGVNNGELVKEEADLPTLSVTGNGNGNVVTSISVDETDKHKLIYETASVATSEDVAKLSAATIALSAATITLSGDVVEYVKVVSGNIETVINELSAGTEADIKALSAGTIADNNKLSADVITYINTISGYASSEIHELSASVVANETDIDNLSSATLDLSAVTLTGVSLNNTPLTVTGHVVSVPVTTSGSGIAAAENSGSVADAKAVKEYVENILSSSVDYKGATDSEPSNPSKGDLWIAASAFTVDGQNAEVGDFIIYNGSNWDVIEKNLDGAITGTLSQDTVTLGDSTNSVKSLANGANGTVLTMVDGSPAWANDPELTVASAGTGNVVTDITVNDHAITFTKGVTAADSADLQTLSGMVETISGYTKENFTALSAGTIQLSADTKSAIEALSAGTIQLSADTESAIAAAIAGLDSSGAVSTTGMYMTSVTIADGIITEVGEEALPAATPVTTVNGATGDTATAVLNGIYTGGTDGHQLTLSATNKIFSAVTSDSAITVVSAQTSVNAVSAQTSVHAESADTAAALTGNITSGQVTDLVDGITNTKVNSASTAESADTAASADKVANKLTATDGTNNVEYDGSDAKTLTFGTVGETNLRSMSMTSAGVVDVDVIDCGSY